jgi:hypothetical protein
MDANYWKQKQAYCSSDASDERNVRKPNALSNPADQQGKMAQANTGK